MKRGLTLFTEITMVLIFLGSLYIPVYATPFVQEPPTGNAIAYCDLVFVLEDKTSGAFIDNINVVLTDITTQQTYNYTFSREDYVNPNLVTHTVLANTTYTLSFYYPYSEMYTIKNSDGSNIADRFGATQSGATFQWILSKAGEELIPTAISSEVTLANNEAAGQYESFYNAVKHMDGNSSWYGFFNTYVVYADVHGGQYADICKSTVENWKSLSEFERFVWYETYVRIVNYMKLSNFEWFFGSQENFINNSIDNAYRNLNTYGNGREAEAYKALMLWQYDYIKQHGTVYNFLTGLNYLESNGNAIPVNPQKELEEREKQEQLEMENAYQELMNEDNQGIWGKTIIGINKNALTILLLLVIAGILVVVKMRRKQKNIEDDKQNT